MASATDPLRTPVPATPVPPLPVIPSDAGPVHASPLRGLAWMLLANVLFATMALAGRAASAEAPWQEVGMSRAAMGALVAIAFAWARRAPLKTKRRGLSWARSLFGTVSMLSTFYALSAKDLPVGDAVTLLATAPIFIALLSGPILGEKPSSAVWWVTAVAFGGIALIAGPSLHAGASSAMIALLAAASSGVAMMFLRKMRATADGASAESVEAIALHFSLVSLAVHVVLAWPTLASPSPRTAVLLVVTGLTGGIAQLCMTRAYALTEAAKLGAVSYLGTVLTQIGAILLLHERPGSRQLLGATLVVGAGLVLAAATARELRKPAVRSTVVERP